jgi:ketosteroid isomerase-like protein
VIDDAEETGDDAAIDSWPDRPARPGEHPSLRDAAEDPEKMLDQMVRDYTANIAEAEAEDAVAQTIGNLRLLERGDTAWTDQHLADDVVWHVGGNSKWAGAYQGKQKVLEHFGRQAHATGGPTSVEIHDVLGNDEHVVVLGSASASAADGSSAEWRFTQVFHIRDGKATEVWGMAENDAAVDPFLDGLPG